MPILDLQQRLVEVGRIRMGAKTERGFPTKLDSWRLTSSDRDRIEAVAQVYGGTVEAWEDEWEVFTTSSALRILLMPGRSLTQWWELWSGGGCKRRCDGFNEVLSGGPCLCPAEMDKRTEGASANPPTACRPTTRLSVLLPDISGIGHWRLETHGFYAAVELAGTASLLEAATAQGQVLPARLRIDPRTKVADGKTTKWNVPVIDIDALLPDVLAIHEAPVASYTPLQQTPGASLNTGLAALEAARTEPAAERVNAAEPIPAAPPSAVAAPEPPPDESLVGAQQPAAGAPPAAPMDNVMISDAQRRLLFATATEYGFDEAALRVIMGEVLQVASTKDIAAAKLESLLVAIRERATLRDLQELGAREVEQPATTEPEPEADPSPPAPEPAPVAEEAAPEPEPQPEPQVAVPEPAAGNDSPGIATAKATVLGPEFTRHAGKTVYDVALADPTYLAWLATPVVKDDVIRAAAQAMLNEQAG